MSIIPFLLPGLAKRAESWGLEFRPIPFEQWDVFEAFAREDNYTGLTRYYENNILGVTLLMRIARGYAVPDFGKGGGV